MKAVGVAGAAGLLSDSARAEAEDVDTDTTAPAQGGPSQAGEFVVKFDGNTVTGWESVSLPAISIEQETTQGNTVFSQPSYDDLEMERGFQPGDTVLWNWINDLRQGKLDGIQREITVTVNDPNGSAQTQWKFTGCWPKNYDPPDLGATSDGAGATESITVSFEGMVRTG